jgi:hypothetical protein
MNNRPVPNNKNDSLIKRQKTWSAAQPYLQTTKLELGTPEIQALKINIKTD